MGVLHSAIEHRHIWVVVPYGVLYHAGEAQPHVPELPAKSNMDNNIAILDKKRNLIHPLAIAMKIPGTKICDDPEKSRMGQSY